ncbi:hypothetical protein DM02DRAFT_734103 [Periconia macrospinosa]|uniref:NB-ARC domain-containing protein n=1 Tax=Periconia macrospinosa TaxID=97972 RepID=A0A2V1D2A7_9PLEO|nr:hypothetical protein DM02DRAFT_734103 [Periconia macrospinosa]
MQENQFKMSAINNKGTIINSAQRDIHIGTSLTAYNANTLLTLDRGPDDQPLSRQVAAIAGSEPALTAAPPERPETPPKPSCVVPFRRDPDFVDRGTLLDQIREKCCAPASRVALVGLGGVGKSQLAIEHGYRVEAASPDTWVFWVHASNAARFEQSYRAIANCVKFFGPQHPNMISSREVLTTWQLEALEIQEQEES